jgi:hypothetical protein
MKHQSVSLIVILIVYSLCTGQVPRNTYSAFEYVYATAGSPDVRVVNVKFKDSRGVKLEAEHDVDFARKNPLRTVTLKSGYIKGRNRQITFRAYQGYYTSARGRATREVVAVLDELIELMPNTGAGNNLTNDKLRQVKVVNAIVRLNELLTGRAR